MLKKNVIRGGKNQVIGTITTGFAGGSSIVRESASRVLWNFSEVLPSSRPSGLSANKFGAFRARAIPQFHVTLRRFTIFLKPNSSVTLSFGDDAPHTASGVTHVPLSPWDQMNVGVTDCLPCGFATLGATCRNLRHP
jgi:hypothetical protein